MSLLFKVDKNKEWFFWGSNGPGRKKLVSKCHNKNGKQTCNVYWDKCFNQLLINGTDKAELWGLDICLFMFKDFT